MYSYMSKYEQQTTCVWVIRAATVSSDPMLYDFSLSGENTTKGTYRQPESQLLHNNIYTDANNLTKDTYIMQAVANICVNFKYDDVIIA